MINKAATFKRTGPRITLFRWTAWFTAANAVVLMLISVQYLKLMPPPDSALATASLGISYLGHFFSLAFYLFPASALMIALYPRRWAVSGLSAALQLALVLGVVIDTLVFTQYRFHLNGMVLNLLASGAAGEVLPMTGKLWLLLALAVLVGTLAEYAIAWVCWRWVEKRRRSVGGGVALAVTLLVLSTHAVYAWADANYVTSVTSQARYLPAFQPLTAKRLLARLGLAGKREEGGLAIPGPHSGLHYPLEQLSFREPPQRLNLLVIAIDSWRFDNLTAEETPNIWRLSQKAWRFENHLSSGNATRFGIFGLFYGLYGTYWHAVLAEERSPVLMRELLRRDYRMGIYASAPLVSPEFDRTVFADIRGKIDLRTGGDSPAAKDRAITDKMLKFIDAQSARAPFFGFMFYDAPHTQGHPPGVAPFQPELKEVNYLKLNNEYDPRPFYNRYRNSVYYVDTLVGEVLVALEKKGLMEQTVVVITGDHGEEFNDLKLNYWGHGGNFSRYQTQTPMVILWPGKGAHVYSHATTHLDLVPTLMKELLGCRNEPGAFSNGRSLLDTGARPFTVISSWDTFSVNEPDRITVTHPAGDIEVLDAAYRPIRGAAPRPGIAVDAMRGMGKFFAR
ncbi:DUF3413 domain-containing protein [Geomonas terrae]|uniref:DUF3413 domain-containing protein n=1 Tax=Geomonas terrae TaxID=2562681 RepID=UPI0013A5CEB4|nr:DUF3413 domain-containing protein [Geomonas terrae]